MTRCTVCGKELIKVEFLPIFFCPKDEARHAGTYHDYLCNECLGWSLRYFEGGIFA